MLDPQVQAVLDEERALVDAGGSGRAPSLAEQRAGYGAMTERFGGRGPAMARELERAVPGPGGGIPVHVYVPAAAAAAAGAGAAGGAGDAGAAGAVVYLHGGGWALGTLAAFHPVCRRVAEASGAVVVSVDYRLAPEHPFPAGVEDALAVVRWAASHAADVGAEPGRLAVMGDSSGATLAAVAARRLAAEGLALRKQVLVHPVTDAAMDTASYARYASGFRLTAAEMAHFWELYAGDADRADPDLSPLRAGALAGSPPALVLLAEHDPLHDEGAAYAARLREAGVPADVVVYPGTVHGFVRWPAAVDVAARMLADAGAALRDALR